MVGLMLHTLFILLGSVSPCRRSASLRLLACHFGTPTLANKLPLKLLLPSRGIMLMRTPPVSLSAELAATLMLYSWKLPSMNTTEESGLVHAEVDIPSISIR